MSLLEVDEMDEIVWLFEVLHKDKKAKDCQRLAKSLNGISADLGKLGEDDACQELCVPSEDIPLYVSAYRRRICGKSATIYVCIRKIISGEKNFSGQKGKTSRQILATDSADLQLTIIGTSNGRLDLRNLRSRSEAIVDCASRALANFLGSQLLKPCHILMELESAINAESVDLFAKKEMDLLTFYFARLLFAHGAENSGFLSVAVTEEICESSVMIELKESSTTKHIFGQLLIMFFQQSQQLGNIADVFFDIDSASAIFLGPAFNARIRFHVDGNVINLNATIIDSQMNCEVRKSGHCGCAAVRRLWQQLVAVVIPPDLSYSCRVVVPNCPELGVVRETMRFHDGSMEKKRRGADLALNLQNRNQDSPMRGEVPHRDGEEDSLFLRHHESPCSSFGFGSLFDQSSSLSSNDNDSYVSAKTDNCATDQAANLEFDKLPRLNSKEHSLVERTRRLLRRSRRPEYNPTEHHLRRPEVPAVRGNSLLAFLQEYPKSATSSGESEETILPAGNYKSDAILQEKWLAQVELGKALYDRDQMSKTEQLAEVRRELEEIKKFREPRSPEVPDRPGDSPSDRGAHEHSTLCREDDKGRKEDVTSLSSNTNDELNEHGNKEAPNETTVHRLEPSKAVASCSEVSPLGSDNEGPAYDGRGAAVLATASGEQETECSGSSATTSGGDRSRGNTGEDFSTDEVTTAERNLQECRQPLSKFLDDDPEKDGEQIPCSDGNFSTCKPYHILAELPVNLTDGTNQCRYYLRGSRDATSSEEFKSFDSSREMGDSAEQGGIDVVNGPASRSTHINGTGGHLVNTASAAEHAGAGASSKQRDAVNTGVTSGNTSEPPSRGVPCNEDSSQQEWGAINTEQLSKSCGFFLINDDEGTSPTRSDHTTDERTEEDTPAVFQLNPRKEDDFTPPKAHSDPAGEEVVDSPQPSPTRWPEAMHYRTKEVLNDPREPSAAKASGNEWDFQGARPKDTQRSLSPPATRCGLDSGFMAKHSSFVARDSTSAGNFPLQPDGNHQTQGCVLGGALAADQVPQSGETHGRLLGGPLATDQVSRTRETHGRLLGGAVAADQVPRTGEGCGRLLGGAPAADQVPRTVDPSRFHETAPREVLKEEALSSEVTADEFSSLGPASMMSMRSLPITQPSDSLPYDFSSTRDPREPWRFARACAGASNDPSAETSGNISKMNSRFDRVIIEMNERDRVASNWFLKRSERSKREQKDKSENEKQEILESEVNRESNQPARAPVQESPRWLCEHYQRRCKVRFPCCGKFYPCHRCHNASDECPKEDVKALQATHIQCLVCKAEQEITEDSHTCMGCNTKMSDYFCPKCKHFTGVEKKPYHCEKCGICRIHKDRSFHCSVCNVCLDKRLEGKHKCRADSGHDECCICLEDAFSGCQILPCSHKVHRDCAIAMLQNGIRSCPVCRHPLYKSASNHS